MFQPTILKHVRILDAIANTDRIGHVFIDREQVTQVIDSQADLPTDMPSQDGNGLVLGTGLVDLYSLSGEPGFEHRETLASLSVAATNGGFSKVVLLPHTKPVMDNLTSLEFVLGRQLHSQFAVWGAITKNCEGKQINDFAEMAGSVAGFSDAKPITNLNLIRLAMEYIQPLGKPLMLWPYDPSLAGDGVMRESKWSLQFGLSGSPAIAETTALAALIELVRLTQAPTHLMRISTARSVELIARAKADGLPITASVPWTHLWLNEQDLATYDPNLRVSPPLGSLEDQEALISAIKNQTIDAIAIDHTPYSYEEKTVAFEVSPPGVIGLEFALPILWQHLVATNKLTALELWQALSSNPANCLNLPSSPLATLFDPVQTWQVNRAAISSISFNTPCYNQVLTGKVVPLQDFSRKLTAANR